MNSVAYGFRDDITDEELNTLLLADLVFECSEHGVLETTEPDEMDNFIALMRSGK